MQRDQALCQPDGASMLRVVYQTPVCEQKEPSLTRPTLQAHGQLYLLTRSPAKLLRYSRLTHLEPYLAQVDLAALHDGWSYETEIHLALALEWSALGLY